MNVQLDFTVVVPMLDVLTLLAVIVVSVTVDTLEMAYHVQVTYYFILVTIKVPIPHL